MQARKGVAAAFMTGATRRPTPARACRCGGAPGLSPRVRAAFRSGAVMGFLLAGNGLLLLFFTLYLLKAVGAQLPCGLQDLISAALLWRSDARLAWLPRSLQDTACRAVLPRRL